MVADAQTLKGLHRSSKTRLWVYGAVCFRVALLDCLTACAGGFVVPEGKTVPHSVLSGLRTGQGQVFDWVLLCGHRGTDDMQ